MRKNINSGAPWEKVVGYSRAVKIGPLIEVSGTTALVDGKIMCVGDLAGQTRIVLQKIVEAVVSAGGSKTDIIRTRMFVTDIDQWEKAGHVHGEFFGEILPATSMIEVKRLIDPQMLIEIEATAYVII